MRTVFLASLRTHTRRYVAAAIAVIVSVAFAVVVGVLTAGARSGLMEGFGAPYRNADHVVDADHVDDTLDTSVAIEIVERLGENASGLGLVLLPMRAGDRSASEATVGPIAPAEEMRWQKLISGRFPERTGEAVVHVWDAQARGIAIGDRIRIGEGATATDLEVVGLVESPSPSAQASVYVTWPQFLHWRDHPSFHVSKVAVRGEVGQLPEGAALYSPEEYVTAALAKLHNRTDAFALMLLVFAGIALFVSVLVIANTFSILFAQRLRDFALLRCIGATRRQVVGSVRREAAAVGVLASLTGTLVGVGLGYGLIAL
ncbi:ABC transporter permease, partial [Nonomuraea sp. NPDC049784]|uniref:ABC transporter permease n=1 Tax=Nonomuraea sp. NPDC049784 TaxID=3154361 RepID=UPI0033ED345B